MHWVDWKSCIATAAEAEADWVDSVLLLLLQLCGGGKSQRHTACFLCALPVPV